MKLRIILLLLLLFVAALSYSVISLKEDEKVCIPCEEDVRDYLHDARKNLCELNKTLKSIHSGMEANVAVYEIAKIAYRNIDRYNHVHFHKESRKEALDRVCSIMDIEDSEKQERAYADFLEEYSRLKQCNFYDSKSLAVLLSFYFVVDSQDGLLFAWFPTANLRTACAQPSQLHKQTYAGNVRRLWIKKHFDDLVDQWYLNNNRYRGGVPLLFLDALDGSGNRGSHDEMGDPVHPRYQSLRGKKAYFEACFCRNFCIRKDAVTPVGKNGSEQLSPNFETLDLFGIDRETAKIMHGFFMESSREEHVYLIFRLSKPFQRNYLVLLYPTGEQYPYALTLVDDLEEFVPGFHQNDRSSEAQSQEHEGTLYQEREKQHSAQLIEEPLKI